MIASKEKSESVGAAEAGALGAAADGVVPANYSINNSKSGHGIMAEEAQTIIDRLKGRNAAVVGRDNAKNGADRLVNGAYIQTKFYNSGKECIEACFDGKNGGMYRYLDEDGNPMAVEVPEDMYGDAVAEFRSRISKGKVPGVTDQNRAESLVRASDLTYKQSVALCTPMTKESLLYDCATGFFRCLILFFASWLAVFFLSIKRGVKKSKAVVSALKNGCGVFGLSYIIHVACSQFARTAFFKALPFPKIGERRSIYAFDAAMITGAGGGYSSMRGAANRFPKTVKLGVFCTLITLVLWLLIEVFNLIRKKSTFAEFKISVFIILGSKIIGGVFYLLAGILMASVTSLPFVLNTAVCAVAAILGGVWGRAIVFKILGKVRV